MCHFIFILIASHAPIPLDPQKVGKNTSHSEFTWARRVFGSLQFGLSEVARGHAILLLIVDVDLLTGRLRPTTMSQPEVRFEPFSRLNLTWTVDCRHKPTDVGRFLYSCVVSSLGTRRGASSHPTSERFHLRNGHRDSYRSARTPKHRLSPSRWTLFTQIFKTLDPQI